MKFLAILLTVPILAVTAGLTPGDLMQFGIVNQRCRNEFSVDPTVRERIRAGESVNDPQFDCYLACLLEGMNLMGPDGSLNVDAAIDKIPDAPFHDNLAQAITSCANQQGQNKCATAHNLSSCLREQGAPNILQGV